MPIKGVFITGTDTGVGKTLISAVLTKAWQGCYWKPLQTGLAEEQGDTATVQHLAELSPDRIIPPYYALKAPLSPLMAAQKENVTINIKQFTLPDVKSPLIIEGAGGLMVPITPDFLMIDLIAQLKLPVVLVARPHLGTLNHTLLSIDALSRRNIAVLGFVFNEGDNPENRHVIEHIGKTSCLFHLPSYNTLEPALISELAHLVPPLDRLSYGRSAEFSLQSF